MSKEVDFDEFYAACGQALIGQLYLLTGNREEARDCVQEALERAWLKWDSVSQLAEPQAWVRLVARRLAVSRWRKARNALLSMGRAHREEKAPDPTETFGIREEIVHALAQLPKGQRTVVVLHYLCDLDINSISEETGASVGSVKTQLHRGRKQLAEILRPNTQLGTSVMRPKRVRP